MSGRPTDPASPGGLTLTPYAAIVSEAPDRIGSRREAATDVHEFFSYWYEWVRSPTRRRLTEYRAGLPQSAAMILHRVFVVGPIRISELARSLGLDKSTISRQLEPLRTARLLDEEPDATNRRASKVSLSVRGRQLIDRIAESNIDYWESVLDHLSVTEQRQLARLLGRLRQAIDAQDVVLHRQAEEQRWSGRET